MHDYLIIKYNTTHSFFIHSKTQQKKKNKFIEKLMTKMNEQIHNLLFRPLSIAIKTEKPAVLAGKCFLSSYNEWILYMNLLQLLHLFGYCIESHNRVKYDPGEKNGRKNH
jgi:hypothetical protein